MNVEMEICSAYTDIAGGVTKGLPTWYILQVLFLSVLSISSIVRRPGFGGGDGAVGICKSLLIVCTENCGPLCAIRHLLLVQFFFCEQA